MRGQGHLRIRAVSTWKSELEDMEPFIRPNKARNGTGAKGGLCQILSDTISQLFSTLTSLAHWGCLVEFGIRLTLPIFTMLLVNFVGFQENVFLTRKC